MMGIKTLNYDFAANLVMKFYLRSRSKKIKTGFKELSKYNLWTPTSSVPKLSQILKLYENHRDKGLHWSEQSSLVITSVSCR